MVKNGGKYEPMDLQRLIELSNKASVWHISFHLPTGCNIFVVIYILNQKKSLNLKLAALHLNLGQVPLLFLVHDVCNLKEKCSHLTFVSQFLGLVSFSFK